MMSSVNKQIVPSCRFVGDLTSGTLVNRMDHLACFLGGTLMLATRGAKDEASVKMYTDMAVGLTETCHHAYKRTASGLGPDIMDWSPGRLGQGFPGNNFFLLRPEVSVQRGKEG